MKKIDKMNFNYILNIKQIIIILLIITINIKCGNDKIEEPQTSISPINKVDILTIGSYKAIKIGEQIWMLENLNVKTFKNGDTITHLKRKDDSYKWEYNNKNKTPFCCFYKDNAFFGKKYGKLYNWYAVNDPRGLAPQGWHIPSREEWLQLNNFIGDNNSIILKSKKEWNINKRGQNMNGTNKSGFNAIPGGFREQSALFSNVGYSAYWWSSSSQLDTNTKFTIDNAVKATMENYVSKVLDMPKSNFSESNKFKDNAIAYSLNYSNKLKEQNYNKTFGMSIRCVKN